MADKSPRLSPYFLASERRSIPDLVWRQEYECEFVTQMGAIFRHEDITNMLTSDVLPLFEGEQEQHLIHHLLAQKVAPLFEEG